MDGWMVGWCWASQVEEEEEEKRANIIKSICGVAWLGLVQLDDKIINENK